MTWEDIIKRERKISSKRFIREVRRTLDILERQYESDSPKVNKRQLLGLKRIERVVKGKIEEFEKAGIRLEESKNVQMHGKTSYQRREELGD